MAAIRRGQSPLNLSLPSNPNSTLLPPISALFLIYFDIKAGYTIGWKRSLPGVVLEGVVEYKSLPSGLHTVNEDLIYFVHEDHAGLSAFVNRPAEEEIRGARMIAVGVLVPLSFGRLGRCWVHAEGLREMASELILDESKTEALEEYWEKHKAQGSERKAETDSLLDSPSSIRFKPSNGLGTKGHTRNRSASDGTALILPGHNLSLHHPAWSLLRLLETFGPMVFPIHRAALLRKRILISGHAPVQETCNFVYDISVLSNIPLAVSDLLAPNAPPQRLRPLFCIGVHDIPLLEEDLRASKATSTSLTSEQSDTIDESGCGWIACTTDSILAMKSALYDVLITMPPPHSSSAAEKVWPKVESPQGVEVKATQRDLRRYKTLRWELSRQVSPPGSPSTLRRRTSGDVTESEPERSTTTSASQSRDDFMLELPDAEDIIEPLSWSALAYEGFLWWASAGEQSLQTQEETDSDMSLLSGLSLSPSTPRSTSLPQPQSTTSLGLTKEGEAKQETAIIAYFHRLTTQFLTTLSDIVDSTDSDSDNDSSPLMTNSQISLQTQIDGEIDEEDMDESGPKVYVKSEDVVRMGLDVWSKSDHAFIQEFVRLYFARRAAVEGRIVDVCGIRIC